MISSRTAPAGTETTGTVIPASAVLPRLAAVDIGTNSIRLVVAELQPDGSYRVLDEDREMTRLGTGLFETGELRPETMELSLQVIGRMKAIAEGFAVQDLRAIATSAVREASNGREFCNEAWRRCRVRIEVVSPEEEAKLVFKSVARHYRLDDQLTAIVDIGGGSTEVILAAGGVVDQLHSLPLGAVRLTERYVRSDPLKNRHWKQLRRAIDQEIEHAIGTPPFVAEVMIGSGGTFTNLVEMAQAERDERVSSIRDYTLGRAEVVRLLDRLRETPLALRRQIPGLNPKRADIMLAGAAVVSRLTKQLGTVRILVNDRGIRDGVLLSMIEELQGAAVKAPAPVATRLEAARRFARQCRSNERHCEHVGRLASQLFDALRDAFALPEPARDVLQAAALLHDVGYLVNHEKHHKHAYHLIMNGDLRGFSAREIELIANVARYHRRAFPKRRHKNFARLDRVERRLVRRLSGILRVADGLDRTHSQAVTGLRCRMGDGWVRVLVTASRDPGIELDDAQRKADLFERAFKSALTLSWVQPKTTTVRREHPSIRRAAGTPVRSAA
ncbi:MAG TPA: Ppx/GppA phosphatase family protein [Gemmatimonadales bacterium]|nr:Ppx/GppA phosphatase family protein [Gemmatimonadales bacterium]